MTIPFSDLQAIAPSSIIELYELELNAAQHGINDVYRFHAGVNADATGDIIWAGNSYLRFPIEAEGFEYTGNGQLPRPKVRVSNIMGTITALLLSLPDGLEGAKFTRIRTLARYIDAANFPGNVNPYGTPNATVEFPREIYYVDQKTTETRDVVEFELAAAFDLAGIRAPKRQCIANICQWQYRSAECSYTESSYYDANDQPVSSLAADVCGKRLSSCEIRFNSFSRSGTVSSGSNQLTLTSSVSAGAGTPISGHGVPAGTTVSSVSSNGLIVTMSQNATATSSVTTTGTIQSSRTALVVSSAAGLAVGMTITGPNIAAGTTISGINSNTITLSQQALPPYVFYDARTGTLFSLFNTTFLNVSTSGLTSGMAVTGPGLPDNFSATITSVSSLFVALSYAASPRPAATYSFYTLGSYSAQSYSFLGSPTYVFRGANNELPYGSFPGIGTYFA